ncbi:glutamate racemase [Duncaniella dubosii]|uniref:glutamate racemase n=1 Tax=Duncaniella dubosii TaxID=2518971 RepID=UPI0032B2BE9B
MKTNFDCETGPIGVFDSGYGGLTILSSIRQAMPDYDYIYLGDNARAPYGTRSFDIVYRFTLEAVKQLFDRGCHLVILACNTASAKALRTIQQRDLPQIDPSRRVLGVIRPTVEAIGDISRNGHVGIFATPGTVASGSYEIEISHLHPDFKVTSHACPMWVPLVENREADRPGADYFVRQETEALMKADNDIDTIVLGCTHYPLLYPKIREAVAEGIEIVKQGDIVARSLADYLRRHPEMDNRLTRGGTTTYLTTESPEKFSDLASLFLGEDVKAERVEN